MNAKEPIFLKEMQATGRRILNGAGHTGLDQDDVMLSVALRVGQLFGGHAVYFAEALARDLKALPSFAQFTASSHMDEPLMDAVEMVVAIVEEGTEVLAQAGIDRFEATHLMFKVACELMWLLCGQAVYIPRFHLIRSQRRNAQIKREFNGKNQRDLARRYDLSLVQLYTILRGGRAKSPPKRALQNRHSHKA